MIARCTELLAQGNVVASRGIEYNVELLEKSFDGEWTSRQGMQVHEGRHWECSGASQRVSCSVEAHTE